MLIWAGGIYIFCKMRFPRNQITEMAFSRCAFSCPVFSPVFSHTIFIYSIG